jgi:glycosyltransferase involved in cell wall biosynthesis
VRICMVTRELPPDSGGIGYYVYNLSKKLIERGHEVAIITRGPKARSTQELIEGIEVFRVSFFPIYPFHIWVHGAFDLQIIWIKIRLSTHALAARSTD